MGDQNPLCVNIVFATDYPDFTRALASRIVVEGWQVAGSILPNTTRIVSTAAYCSALQ
jgi:hypothetical protein